MTRIASRAVAALGWAVLAIAAAAGVTLATVSLLATAPFSRAFIATRAVQVLDDQIAGHVALKSIGVLPGAGIELRGLEISDPEGHLVLSVGRARVQVDLTGLRRRAVGVSVELEAPSVLLEEERGGGVSVARAFAPSHPSAPKQPGGGGSAWTVYVSRLAIRDGDVWWVDAAHDTRLQASGLDLDARGLLGPGRTRVELRLRGALDAPVTAPLSLEVAGGITGDTLRVPVLRAQLGRTAVALVGEGDLARSTGRLAALRVDVARDLARTVAPEVPPGGDLDAAGYAESDGETLTAAVRAEPTGAEPGGRADAAVALRLTAARAIGFDVALDRLDPSRLAAEAPRGEVTLTAHGAAAGRSLQDLRGRIEARLQPSRLRGGAIRAAELVARADRGAFEVSRAIVSAPGIALDANARWRDRGGVSGRVVADGSDLAALARNLAALLGTRPAALGGRAHVQATLGGTADAPTASAVVDAPLVRVGALALSGVRVTADGAGPARAPSVRIDGRVAGFRNGSTEVARGVSLHGSLAEGTLALDAVASLPGFDEPARIEARGRLSAALDTLAISTLALSYPGTRWGLAAPATVALEGPSVDRLELAQGDQRIVLAGGVTRGGELDARLSLARLDLGRVPFAAIARNGVKGELSADATAKGRTAAPAVNATLTLGGGAMRGLAGIAAVGSAEWRGADRRLTGSVSVTRAAAAVDVSLDLPLPLAARRGERIQADVRAAGLPVAELLAAAGTDVDAAGLLTVDGSVAGTVGKPNLRLSAALAEGRWRDLGGIALRGSAEDAGERLSVTANVVLQGAALANVRAEAPLELGALLTRPAETLRALRAAPLAGSVAVTGLELASISGRAGVPEGIAGHVDADAKISGSIARPRADLTVDLSQGAWAGYRDLGAHAALKLAPDATSATGRLAIAGEEALRFGVTLAAPPERLASFAAIRTAPLKGEAVIPRVSLERTGPRDVPLAGTLSGTLTASGTPGNPEAALVLEGEGVAVSGRPLGKARLDASYARARATAALLVTPPKGGTLRASAAVRADLGLGVRRSPLGDAPAEATLSADGVDLSVLAALLPGRIRSAGGTLTADASARGPLARLWLSPRGSLRVREGHVAVVEYGEFSAITLDASGTEDAFEVTNLEVHRGKGKLTGAAALRGLSTERGRLEGQLESSDFTVSRAGMPVATLDLHADAKGTWEERTLSMDVTIPRGVVRLPNKQPRTLQPLGDRTDIVVGRPVEREPSGGRSSTARERFAFVLHVVIPRQLFVKGDDPRVDAELKADVTYEASGGEDYARGYVETVRGTVEPIAGRTFTIDRARVQFTGGPPSAATLDIEAKYENPVAVVTAKIVGPAQKPEITLSSVPPMDEAQIALLIATGQRELKAGTGSVGTLTGAEAGKAALGALATTAFRELVANKLPIDTFSLDSGALRAGKYVTDKIYVGYVRRFEADPTRGENPDEVRIEYHITQRWNFESRYGTAQSGGASLIWSKDF